MKKHYHLAHSYANAPTDIEAQKYTSRLKAENRLKDACAFAFSVGWSREKKGNKRIGYYLIPPPNYSRSKDELIHIVECEKEYC